MFDCEVATDFTLGKTKCGYFINHSIAPYFQNEIIKTVKNSPCFSVSFDESLNKIYQEEQMDLNVRYWDEENGMTKVNYLTSLFLNAQMWKTSLMNCLRL